MILSTIFWIFGFLRMSPSGFAAQAKRAGDEAELRAVLLRALIVAALTVMNLARGVTVWQRRGQVLALAA